MVNVITSFSRITILSYIIIFTIIDCIQIFEFRISEAINSILSTIQAVMLVLFVINSSVVLFFVKEEPNILVLMALQLIFMAVFGLVTNSITTSPSKGLLNNILLLLSISFITLERLNLNKSIKQFVFAMLALAFSVLIVFLLRKVTYINRYMMIFAIVGVLSLLMVATFGKMENGARLSLSFASFRIQPSEFVKLTYLFFIAGCIVTWKDFRGFLIAGVGAAAHVLALVFARDLGTALIFLVTYVFLIFIAYKNYVVLAIEFGVGVIGGLFAYNYFPHIKTRFIAWTDPLSVVDNQGYQISQSLFAIGTGSWLGAGLGKGMPNKIPVVVNDFIFAAIAEELGVIVAMCLIIIVFCTAVMIFNLSYNCTYSFYMLVVSGIAIIYAIQSILNIGGVIKFIPSTGVTLPFVSYGGSSLFSMFVGLFIAQCSEDLWRMPNRTHRR